MESPEDDRHSGKVRHKGLLQTVVDHEKSSDEDLARITGLTKGTVHTYWRHICEDLQAHSRSDAIIKAFNLGITRPRSPAGTQS